MREYCTIVPSVYIVIKEPLRWWLNIEKANIRRCPRHYQITPRSRYNCISENERNSVVLCILPVAIQCAEFWFGALETYPGDVAVFVHLLNRVIWKVCSRLNRTEQAWLAGNLIFFRGVWAWPHLELLEWNADFLIFAGRIRLQRATVFSRVNATEKQAAMSVFRDIAPDAERWRFEKPLIGHSVWKRSVSGTQSYCVHYWVN